MVRAILSLLLLTASLSLASAQCNDCGVTIPSCGVSSFKFTTAGALQCDVLKEGIDLFQNHATDATCKNTVNTFFCDLATVAKDTCKPGKPKDFDTRCNAAIACLDSEGSALATSVSVCARMAEQFDATAANAAETLSAAALAMTGSSTTSSTEVTEVSAAAGSTTATSQTEANTETVTETLTSTATMVSTGVVTNQTVVNTTVEVSTTIVSSTAASVTVEESASSTASTSSSQTSTVIAAGTSTASSTSTAIVGVIETAAPTTTIASSTGIAVSSGEKCYGLAIGDGGDLSAYQIGAFQALVEKMKVDEQKYKVVSGVGSGNLLAAFFATYPLGQERAMSDNLMSVFANLTSSALYKKWDNLSDCEAREQHWSLYDNSPFKATLNGWFNGKTLSSDRHVLLTATNLEHGNMEIWNLTSAADLTNGVLAGTASPGIFAPFYHEGKDALYTSFESSPVAIYPIIKKCRELGFATGDIVIDALLSHPLESAKFDAANWKPSLEEYLMKIRSLRSLHTLRNELDHVNDEFAEAKFRHFIYPAVALQSNGFEFNHTLLMKWASQGAEDAAVFLEKPIVKNTDIKIIGVKSEYEEEKQTEIALSSTGTDIALPTTDITSTAPAASTASTTGVIGISSTTTEISTGTATSSTETHSTNTVETLVSTATIVETATVGNTTEIETVAETETTMQSSTATSVVVVEGQGSTASESASITAEVVAAASSAATAVTVAEEVKSSTAVVVEVQSSTAAPAPAAPAATASTTATVESTTTATTTTATLQTDTDSDSA